MVLKELYAIFGIYIYYKSKKKEYEVVTDGILNDKPQSQQNGI